MSDTIESLSANRIALGDAVRLMGGQSLPDPRQGRLSPSEAYMASHAAWMAAERAYGLAMRARTG